MKKIIVVLGLVLYIYSYYKLLCYLLEAIRRGRKCR